ncbi:pre-16S rRNA-processing nuclease YqgF [Alkalinema sp. FACHB-956]|uniref:pre-16S rRNA-processing nuclease YqgF n=1 Tax=Alkalinema sp. FACHB-956 TaxID=2692768 RepID=UPI001F54CE77|nr:pre-16S rRNA-processing nuclease YqgF [Alkalinema sp. FACHB-956]
MDKRCCKLVVRAVTRTASRRTSDGEARGNMYYLGFDPGRDKCGVAIVDDHGHPPVHEVIAVDQALTVVETLCQHYPVRLIVLGDQTGSKAWQKQFQGALPEIPVQRVDERFSSLEARDRYWQLHPPQGLQKLIPQGMRTPPRPIDDLVAIILVERYLKSLESNPPATTPPES